MSLQSHWKIVTTKPLSKGGSFFPIGVVRVCVLCVCVWGQLLWQTGFLQMSHCVIHSCSIYENESVVTTFEYEIVFCGLLCDSCVREVHKAVVVFPPLQQDPHDFIPPLLHSSYCPIDVLDISRITIANWSRRCEVQMTIVHRLVQTPLTLEANPTPGAPVYLMAEHSHFTLHRFTKTAGGRFRDNIRLLINHLQKCVESCEPESKPVKCALVSQ